MSADIINFPERGQAVSDRDVLIHCIKDILIEINDRAGDATKVRQLVGEAFELFDHADRAG
ncbi:hypothetical protein ACELLULO517_27465 [Acidisoma cellulosilytica]|uniref:Uncharacterized protein n=1 Tax=Acidisoma cellulosilyticum TaxID=2802395 RepID=A0A963Z8V5_9PROT|nr:hypothetical protein [Acidisoma cellulosilyticum]MCB8884007.1 hypothetical protein [Acidisoma cellulosilyticum]